MDVTGGFAITKYRRRLSRLLTKLGGPAIRALSTAGLQASYDLNRGPAMAVETNAEPAKLEEMWDRISRAWNELGHKEPLWSVLSDSRYLSGAKPSQETVRGFYDSGRGDRDYLLSFLKRAVLSPSQFRVVAEYGCGIGRTTRWLASSFENIRALDISAAHLARASSYLEESRISNVRLVHLRGRDELAELSGIDLFFSIIVLQHNPPPLILDILHHAFAGLNPGGLAFFQVPTYSIDYAFSIDAYLRNASARGPMEGHFVPQAEIFKLASRHGLSTLEVRQDHCLGHPEVAISNTFLMRKSA